LEELFSPVVGCFAAHGKSGKFAAGFILAYGKVPLHRRQFAVRFLVSLS
jgi:hypothetical protein